MVSQGGAIEGQVGPWVRLQDLLGIPPLRRARARQLEKRLGVVTSPPPHGPALSWPPPQVRWPRARGEKLLKEGLHFLPSVTTCVVLNCSLLRGSREVPLEAVRWTPKLGVETTAELAFRA